MMGRFFDIMQETFLGCVIIITVLMVMIGFSSFLGSLYSFVFELNAAQEMGAGFGTICFAFASWHIGHKAWEIVELIFCERKGE